MGKWRQTENFREDSLIEEIKEFTWGIHTKISVENSENSGNSKCMFFVPVYDVLGENLKCKKINGLWMKYFKTDRSKFGEKILIKLKVCTVVEEETELDSNEVVDVDYNLEFTVESFKTITIMDSKSKDENSRSLKEFYFVVKYFPEVFRQYK